MFNSKLKTKSLVDLALSSIICLIVFLYAIVSGSAEANPILRLDQTTQQVTHCSFVLNTDAKIDVPVSKAGESSTCDIDMAPFPANVSVVKAAWVYLDANGRVESPMSTPFYFHKAVFGSNTRFFGNFAIQCFQGSCR